MKKAIVSSALAFLGSQAQLEERATLDPNEPLNPKGIENIILDSDGTFEENWEFTADEVPLKPNEIFSCQEAKEKVEWEKQELSAQVFHMAVGSDKQIYALSSARKDKLADGRVLLKYDFDKQNWSKITSKGAKQIAVDQDGSIWIVNALNHIYQGKNGSWTRVFGKATTISIGGDGSIFILGTDKSSGGYEIFKLDRDTQLWQKFPGRAMRIAVDLNGNPWIISAQSKIYRYTEEGWEKMDGTLSKQIMSGHDGSIYVLDNVKTGSGYGVWKFSHEREVWNEVNGRAFFLAVSDSGKPYAIRARGQVYWPEDSCLWPIRIQKPKLFTPKTYKPCRNYRRVVWHKQVGTGKDIAVGVKGAIWALGEKKSSNGFQIKRWTGQGWEMFEESGERISVDGDGNPWVVRKDGKILKYNDLDQKFDEIVGRARDISIGATGDIYAIGWQRTKKGYPVQKWNGKSWTPTSGYGFRVAVDQKGSPWVVTRRHKVFRLDGKKWKRVRGSLDDIAIGPEGSIIGVRKRFGVWKYNLTKSKWYKIGRWAASVAVGPGGRPFITTSKGTIFWAEPECPDTFTPISRRRPAKNVKSDSGYDF